MIAFVTKLTTGILLTNVPVLLMDTTVKLQVQFIVPLLKSFQLSLGILVF